MSLPDNITPDPTPEPDPALDPYYMWAGLGPDDALPFDTVCAGFTRYLAACYRIGWDAQTERKLPWYLNRDEGLLAWAHKDARNRLMDDYHSEYRARDFHTMHFRESVRKGGIENLKDPFWSALILHAQLEGKVEFLRYIAELVNQQEPAIQPVMRLFCVYWDRLSIPLAFWSYPAIAAFLQRALIRGKQEPAPKLETIQKWTQRLGLKQEYPLVVPRFHPRTGPVIVWEAFEYHKIPED